MIRGIITLLSCGIMLTNVAHAVECKMTKAFDQPDKDRVGGSAPIWKGTGDGSRQALFFSGSMHVNTDGTKRSYHLEDFWGAKQAVNNLCNAMSDACKGLNKDELRNRRILTQKAYADGWPSTELIDSRISSQIIPFKNGKPCPLVEGYLVSATALYDQNKSDVCDPSRYLDALTVPAIVLPKRSEKNTPTGFELNGAKIGDLVVVLTPSQNTPVYAVVGDLGPAHSLGEGSIALNGALNNLRRQPKNYADVKGNWDVKEAAVLIFPRTSIDSDPYLTKDRIEADGRKAFIAWGGIDENAATNALKSCFKHYNANN